MNGQLVLDLGCGIGDLASDIAARGAHVIGIDANEESVRFASERDITNAEFRVANLHTFGDSRLIADGIWSSFTAAYSPLLRDIIAVWADHLRPGGWIALTEMDDLFAHGPVSNRTESLLNRYVDDSFGNSRYDFRMGRKMADVLRQCDFVVARELTVPDAELSFTGAACAQVVGAWRASFDRMSLLRDFCGQEFETVREEFLHCLTRDDHYCRATVQCCVANKKTS